MVYVTIRGKEGLEVRQLLSVIDILEEHHFGEANSEHRYASIQKDGKRGRKVSFFTELPIADMMRHFQCTGAATLSIVKGDLQLAYNAKSDPYRALKIGKDALLPSVMESTPF